MKIIREIATNMRLTSVRKGEIEYAISLTVRTTPLHTDIYPPLLLCLGRNDAQRWSTTSRSMYGTSLQKSRCLDGVSVSVDCSRGGGERESSRD